MSAGKPIKISVLTDARDAPREIGKVGDALTDAERTAERAGRGIDEAMRGVGEAADGVASTSAQVAGGLGDLGGALSMMPGPLGAVGTGMEALSPAIMGITGVSDLANAALERMNLATKIKAGVDKVAAAGQWALNAAMSANPIALVVIAIVALVAILVIAYKKSETFRNIVNAAFDGVKKGAALLWAGLKFYVGLYVGAFNLVISAAKSVGSAFKSVWDNVSKWLGKAWGYISGLPGKISGAFSGLWSGIAGGLKSAINSVLHLPLKIPVVDTHIPGVGKVGGQTLIPALANGGIVTRPTLALIGEAGPEAVVPLSRGRGMGGDVVNVYLSGTFVGSSKAELGRWVTDALDAYRTVGGRRRA